MKNKNAAITAMILTTILAAVSITGCAQGTIATSSMSAQESAPVEDDTASATGSSAEGAVQETEASDDWQGEIKDIKVMLFDMNGINEGKEPIVDAMNAITEKSIGVRADIQFVSVGEYGTQLSLGIASGDSPDLVSITPMTPANITALVANKQLMDISELLAEDGKDILDMMGGYLDAMSVGDAIYGVPAYRCYGSGTYLIMLTSVLEELQIEEQASNAETWADVEAVYDAVISGTSRSPIGGPKNVMMHAGNLFGGEAFSDVTQYDSLGDTMNIIFTDGEGQVSFLPENPAYREQQDRVREWYNKGYVYKDSLISDMTAATEWMKQGVTFSAIATSEIGVEASYAERCAEPVTVVEISKNMLGSTYINKFGLGVPVTAQEPEAAVRWLNAIYTDSELINLLVWGVEGEHYVINDKGEAAYPEGIDSTNAQYHKVDFLYGNYFLMLPWEGSGTNFRQEALEFLNDCPTSPYMGFVVDASSIENITTALSAVYQQYVGDIQCGNYTDEYWDEYIAALKTAGADEYVAAFQEQLDAWMTQN